MTAPLNTPDGRYLVIRGRLWRQSNPSLPADRRAELVTQLMDARRAVGVARKAGDRQALTDAGRRVDEAKVGLGERGPVWWTDGAPDVNRHLVHNTAYAEWWKALPEAYRQEPKPNRPSNRLHRPK
ncbi:MAG: hypothetical protein V4466_02915 [Pseudomonadota bacterium]